MIKKFRIQFSRIFVVALAIIIALYESAWETKAPFVTGILFLLGCILVGIASLGRLWCSVYIAGHKTESLVTEGPYSMCRNPLYFFSLFGAVGVGFATETVLIPLVIFLAFAIYYPFVIRNEESRLLEVHGDKFKAYMKNVPRFFPNIWVLKEPEKYTVNPIVYKKHMFDALWFIWLIGILEIIELLHELHVLPVIFKLY